MVAMLIVFGVLVVGLAGVAGWLLVQRGEAAAKIAGAEEAVRGADARRVAAEAALTGVRVELTQVRELAEEVGRERAGLIERLRAAEEAREVAVKAARVEHGLELDKVRSVHGKALEAMQEAHRVLEENLARYRTDLTNTFASLASNALQKNTDELIKLADQTIAAKTGEATIQLDERRRAVEALVKPIADTLTKTDEKLAAIEGERGRAYADLNAQIRLMQQGNEQVRVETAKLARALRDPNAAGAMGQWQLERIAEFAGMRKGVDYLLQDHTHDAEGNALRPDMVVKFPNGRELVIDAKANIKAFVDATLATNPTEADRLMDVFAQGVYTQAKALGKKKYWSQYEGSPDFVVMFLPGDQFVDTARSREARLFENFGEHQVILAGPSAFLSLLRVVAMCFAEQRLSEEAKSIRLLVRDLHRKIVTALEHADQLGGSIKGAVVQWNKFVGSVDGMLMPHLRKIEESDARSEKQLPALEPVLIEPRQFQSIRQAGEPSVEP